MVKPFFVVIAGGSGSGKTTLVRRLRDFLVDPGSEVLSLDNYYHDLSHLSQAERRARNFDQPSALDLELFAVHLETLARGEAIAVPSYDFRTHTRAGRVSFDPKAVILVDGIFALHASRVRAQVDLGVFLEASDELRFRRRLKRDVEERGRDEGEITRQYQETVRPMYERHVAATKEHADICLPSEGRVEELVAQVLKLIRGRMSR